MYVHVANKTFGEEYVLNKTADCTSYHNYMYYITNKSTLYM